MTICDLARELEAAAPAPRAAVPRASAPNLGESARELEAAAPAPRAAIPNLGFMHPLARKAVQAVNSIYWL
jgi:hypothetical protein